MTADGSVHVHPSTSVSCCLLLQWFRRGGRQRDRSGWGPWDCPEQYLCSYGKLSHISVVTTNVSRTVTVHCFTSPVSPCYRCLSSHSFSSGFAKDSHFPIAFIPSRQTLLVMLFSLFPPVHLSVSFHLSSSMSAFLTSA